MVKANRMPEKKSDPFHGEQRRGVLDMSVRTEKKKPILPISSKKKEEDYRL
jgi:hypothetical protein